MGIKSMIASEYNKRVRDLSEKVTEKEKKLSDIEKKYSKFINFRNDRSYCIEKKYSGLRSLIHKKGDEIKIVNDKNDDLTKYFPSIVSQALQLSESDFVVDCDIVKNKGFESIKNKSIVEKSNTAFVFDCVYFEDDITYLNLIERKKILDRFNYSDNIKKSPSIIVDNIEDARKAIRMFNIMDGSNGVMIKRLNGKYFLNESNPIWISYSTKKNV